MTLWRVTHTDAAGQRRRLLVLAASSAQADAVADGLFGPARGSACIRLTKGR